MAKTHGPLMSLNASGTIAGSMTHRRSAGANIAQANRFRTDKRTPARAAIREAFEEAGRYWYSLPPADREQWRALAARLSLPPFAAFVQEWNRQQSTTLNPPLLPA